jgi:hypothetical protein
MVLCKSVGHDFWVLFKINGGFRIIPEFYIKMPHIQWVYHGKIRNFPISGTLRCEDKRWLEVQGEYYCPLCNKQLQLASLKMG